MPINIITIYLIVYRYHQCLSKHIGPVFSYNLVANWYNLKLYQNIF